MTNINLSAGSQFREQNAVNSPLCAMCTSTTNTVWAATASGVASDAVSDDDVGFVVDFVVGFGVGVDFGVGVGFGFTFVDVSGDAPAVGLHVFSRG